MQKINSRMPPPPQLNVEAIQARGLSVVRGAHLTLYSDVRDQAMLNDLLASFDSAVPQWCEMFGVSSRQAEPWHLIACLVADSQRFQGTGLWPGDLPEFPAGFNRGYQIWLFPQEGNYYTRHLLLHEGTHAFMQWFLGGSGPPWYSEGMAEWVGLHTGQSEHVRLQFRPTRREQVEQWGRPKLLRKALDAGRRHRLEQVFDFPNMAFRDVEHYAWAWAACEFLSKHPLTHRAFADLPSQAADTSSRFHSAFRRKLADHWLEIERDWQLYIDELDYGSDSSRAALSHADIISHEQDVVIQLATDRSWQRTGVPISAGDTVTIISEGRFRVSGGEKPWDSESGGITIQYYRGQPLGQLMATLLLETANPTELPIAPALPIGTSRTITFDRAGELLLRINESPARLDDNQGQLTITIQRLR
ncbi:MAG TPA: hypothetical protein PKD54_11890 [Pirellulaceae bacterium]|nr:hypothetical protein [Pirellulaceae bacterium]